MRIFISLSSSIYFRGLTEKFSKAYQDKSHIIWVTPDKSYAQNYTEAEGSLLTYDLKLGTAFNFGFRSLDTSVKIQEVLSRVQRGILSAFREKIIDRDLAMKLNDEVIDLIEKHEKSNKYMKVWEWYSKEKNISSILLRAKFTHIDAMEGIDNNIKTIGILDRNIIKKIQMI
jgi:hypothetical protein